jgi:hypothetical protein
MAQRWTQRSPQAEKSAPRARSKKSEGDDEPSYLCEVGELSAGERRHHDPFAVCGIKVTGKAAVQTIGDAALMHPDWLGLCEEAKMAENG